MKNSFTFISEPAKVSMADEWYDIASLNHFWIERRFQVLKKLAGDLIAEAACIAEIGCGNGLLQSQVERDFLKPVDGFELNTVSLENNLSQCSRLFCYNIHDRAPQFVQRYDILFLFDVIEHITDERSFLESALEHLKPGGFLIINVPALMVFYSKYDEVAGHLRRYNLENLKQLSSKLKLAIKTITYWGIPYVPVLFLRKFMLNRTANSKVISDGFSPRNALLNKALFMLGNMEVIPQTLLGTSLMAVLLKMEDK